MVLVRFNATLNGTISHKYDNDDVIHAITESDLNTELGSSGGFAVLSVGRLNVWKVTYLSLRDGCKPIIAGLRTLRSTLPEKTAIAAIAHNVSHAVWKSKCTITQRHSLLEQFMNYGSYSMTRLLGATLDVSDLEETKFNTLQDLLGASALQITTMGYNCVQYHTDAALDHVCPGGFTCPENTRTLTVHVKHTSGCPGFNLRVRIYGTKKKVGYAVYFCRGSAICSRNVIQGGVGTIDLENADCPSANNVFIYWLAIFVVIAIWTLVMMKCTDETDVGWVQADILAKCVDRENVRQLSIKRDSKYSTRNVNDASLDPHLGSLRAGDEGVPDTERTYWFYLDLGGEMCGPFLSRDMHEMYHDKKFFIDHTTQVREAWWPHDKFYQVAEVFPKLHPSKYFTVNPELPRDILVFLSDSIREIAKVTKRKKKRE